MIGVTIHRPPPTTTPSTHHQHPTPYSPYCNVQARGSRLARIFYSPVRIQCIFCSHQVTPHNYAFFVRMRFTSNTIICQVSAVHCKVHRPTHHQLPPLPPNHPPTTLTFVNPPNTSFVFGG